MMDGHISKIRRLTNGATYRAVCICGFEGGNMVRWRAQARADKHERTGK